MTENITETTLVGTFLGFKTLQKDGKEILGKYGTPMEVAKFSLPSGEEKEFWSNSGLKYALKGKEVSIGSKIAIRWTGLKPHPTDENKTVHTYEVLPV